MFLMDYIISYCQLRETLNSFSLVIALFPPFFLLFRAKHVTFCNDDIFDQGIFKTPVDISVGNQDLTWRRFMFFPCSVRTISPQIIFTQVTG